MTDVPGIFSGVKEDGQWSVKFEISTKGNEVTGGILCSIKMKCPSKVLGSSPLTVVSFSIDLYEGIVYVSKQCAPTVEHEWY